MFAEVSEFSLKVNSLVEINKDLLIEKMTTHELGPSYFIDEYRKNYVLFHLAESENSGVCVKPYFGEIMYVEALAQALGKTTEYERVADMLYPRLIGENNIVFAIIVVSIYEIAEEEIQCSLKLNDGREFTLVTKEFNSIKVEDKENQIWTTVFVLYENIPEPEEINKLDLFININNSNEQTILQVEMPFIGTVE